MSIKAFEEKLKIGHKYEQLVIDKLKQSGFECVQSKGKFKEYDIKATAPNNTSYNNITGTSKPNQVTYIEVKHDGKSLHTGNIYIETHRLIGADLNNMEESGIKATIKGGIYILFFYFKGCDDLYYIKGNAQKLDKYFASIAITKKALNTKEYNSIGYLIDINNINKKFIKKWIY